MQGTIMRVRGNHRESCVHTVPGLHLVSLSVSVCVCVCVCVCVGGQAP